MQARSSHYNLLFGQACFGKARAERAIAAMQRYTIA
jgi:hypothetical protein